MDAQPPLFPELRLLGDAEQPDWQLSDDTRETGRRGVALARQALRDGRRRDRSPTAGAGTPADERHDRADAA